MLWELILRYRLGLILNVVYFFCFKLYQEQLCPGNLGLRRRYSTYSLSNFLFPLFQRNCRLKFANRCCTPTSKAVNISVLSISFPRILVGLLDPAKFLKSWVEDMNLYHEKLAEEIDFMKFFPRWLRSMSYYAHS